MTTIEWTEQTWNPTVGCSKISAGCQNCYAIRQAHRVWGMGKDDPRGQVVHYEGLTEKRGNRIEWTGKIAFAREALEIPLKRKKPTTYFVNSMSDLFHESIPDEWIDQIFVVMALTPQHTYQVLTKRPERMLSYFHKSRWDGATYGGFPLSKVARIVEKLPVPAETVIRCHFPLPNVWLGVSIENQKAANERISWLMRTPTAVRFLSCEPLLEDVDLTMIKHTHFWNEYQSEFFDCWNALNPLDGKGIDWVICGAESGYGARPFDEDWARSLRDQCVEGGIKFFYKQNAKNGRKIPLPELDGRQWAEMPEVSNVR